MGTRADFYVGQGKQAEWLGSVAWDGHPENFVKSLGTAKTEKGFRKAVAGVLSGRDDATLPEHGWPWPWVDSRTTDYAYAWCSDHVQVSGFGYEWFKLGDPEPEIDDRPKTAVFPNMKSRQRVTFGKRSGILLFGPEGIRSENEDRPLEDQKP